MKIETSQPIAILNLNDRSYIVPQWIEVPLGTKLSDIEIIKPTKVDVNPIIAEEVVLGSTGSEYLV